MKNTELATPRVVPEIGVPALHLNYECDARLRAETLRSMLKGRIVKRALHVNCGVAYESIPMLDKFKQLALIDENKQILSRCADIIPPQRHKDVRFIKGDFIRWDSEDKFDLVVSLSVMRSRAESMLLIDELSQRVNRGGYLILQNTDATHPHSLLKRMVRGCKKLVGVETQNMPWLSHSKIKKHMKSKGFAVRKQWRYNRPWFFLRRVVDEKTKYAATRAWYGRVREAKLQALGGEVIYMFKKV